MSAAASANTTQLLTRAHAGDREAFDALYARLYDTLRDIARRQRRKHGSPDTLDTLAVVHEAWCRLVDETAVTYEHRAHFLGIAARTMRRVIVDYARERGALKRGGGARHVTLPPGAVGVEQHIEELVAIDDVLSMLGTFDERLERVAECRLFSDLTQEEIALTLGVSVRTVQRDWKRARAWLQRELTG